MPNPTTRLRLAKGPNQWREIDQIVADCVGAICGRYDDQEQVRSLLTLLDLMTNDRYDGLDRSIVVFQATKEAFHYSTECSEAQEQYLSKLAIPVQQKKTA